MTVGTTVTESAITHYDGQNRLAEFDASGKIVRYYLNGTRANEVLAVDQGGKTAWALHDQLGSVAAWGTYETSTWQLQHQAFDAFGNVVAQTDNLPSWGDLPTVWAGHQLDAATGLYHMQARWYDPRTGQFLSPDPLRFAAGDSNLYRYVSNDPTNAVDLNGLEEIDISRKSVNAIESIDRRFISWTIGPEGRWLAAITDRFGPDYYTLVYRFVPKRGERNSAFYQLVRQTSVPAEFVNPDRVNEFRRISNRGALDIATRDIKNDLLGVKEAKLTFALHMLPTGAAIDHIRQGNKVEAGVAILADSTLILGGAAKFAAATGTTANVARARKLQALTVGIEASLGGFHVVQGTLASANGESDVAAGYFGEAALRLFGATVLRFDAPTRGVPSSLEGLQARIDIYARRAELRAWAKGLSGTEAGNFADCYLSKATYQLNRRLESSGSQYRAISQYGRDALGFEYFGNNRPTGTRFLDVALTNTDRSVVYSGWDARFQSTPYARWNTNAANAEYVRYFNIQEGFVREISVEAARL